MNADEIMKMTLNELTLEQFVFVALTLLVCTAFAVIIFIMILQIIGMLIDLVFYLVCKDKRPGRWSAPPGSWGPAFQSPAPS